MNNNSNSSSDEDTCSTVSFRNEDMMMEFKLLEDNENSGDVDAALIKIDAYSSAEEGEPPESQPTVEDDDDWSDRECRYLAQMNDPRYMTARQRSLLDKKSGMTNPDEVTGIDVPVAVSKEIRTPRQVCKSGEHRRAIRQRQEEEQRVTVERLLKVTQGTRVTKKSRQALVPDSDVSQITPSIRTLSTQREGCYNYVAFSDPELCPKWSASCQGPPVPLLCSFPGCANRKRYSCSKTGKPLCSLKCYQGNLMILS